MDFRHGSGNSLDDDADDAKIGFSHSQLFRFVRATMSSTFSRD